MRDALNYCGGEVVLPTLEEVIYIKGIAQGLCQQGTVLVNIRLKGGTPIFSQPGE